MKMLKITKLLTVILTFSLLCAEADSFDEITNSVYGNVARRYGLDPHILYAVSLMESARLAESESVGKRKVAPTRYALNSKGKAYYFETREEAENKLNEILQVTDNVDVGLMQINVRWHGNKVSKASDLFDIETNLSVGAEILRNGINSTFDNCLGVGRFHTWSDEEKARVYGCRVIRIYNKLLRID